MMMRRVAASLQVPPWLEALLSTHFFAVCPVHPDAPRSERNMFCLDCGGSASSFCLYCRTDLHSGHSVIQIRRSSYHDVVRVEEIRNALDIRGVQTYVINSAQVLFLNQRPQPRGGGRGGVAGASSSPYICEICARALLDHFRFCSLGCKLAGIKGTGDATFVLTPNDDDDDEEEAEGRREESSSNAEAPEESKPRRRGRRGSGSLEETGHEDRSPASLPPPPAFSRRRKGIPRRAPFAS